MIPAEITNLLGKSPHEYFQARMEMINYSNNKGQEKKDKKLPLTATKMNQVENKAEENKAIDF